MHDPLVNRSVLLAGLVTLAVPLSACHTVEGAGEDVQSIGNTIEEGGEEAGQEIGEEAGEID